MKLNKSSILSLSTLSVAILMAGCSSAPTTDYEQVLSEQKQQHEQALVKQRSDYEQEINTLKNEKETFAQRASDAEKRLQASPAPVAPPVRTANVNSELFPPNAQPGQCWSRVLTPAQYTTNTQRVLVSPASEDISIVPAEYTAGIERVLVKEATTRIVPVAATYKTVTERVLVKAAHTHLKTVPAIYETVTERVLDKPAHTAWKRGEGFRSSALETRIDNGTGEIMCLVEVPATYKTVSTRVLKTPESVIEEAHDAEYITVTKRVVDQPATTKTVAIPAEYKVVNVQNLVSPEKQLRKTIPAVYKDVTSSEKVSDEKLAWEEVLCEVNMTNQTVAQLQDLLQKKGSYQGPIDGIYGSMTEKAANAYAKQHGLPGGSRLVSLKTVKHLGLNL